MKTTRLFVSVAALVVLAATAAAHPSTPLGVGLNAVEDQNRPVAPTPTDVKPGSITCEDCPYPFPSSYLPLTLYGQDVRMAFMDVAPPALPMATP